jgi:hypothetical protein
MNKQLIRKNKLSLSLALALGVGMAATSGTALAVDLDNNDRLGDAGIFQYYTAQGGWQTFIRVINTSEDGVSVKVRFREAANSREVLDFIVFLSPYDVWSAWTDGNATGNNKPGLRTADTSCLYPYQGNNLGEGWVPLGGGVKGVDFQDRAFTSGAHGDYDDHAGMASNTRMAEGHIEMIGIAEHDADTPFTRYISHDHDTGYPESCSQAATMWGNGEGEGFRGEDLGNVLAFNGYLINVSTGQGGGFDPDVLTDFVDVEGGSSQCQNYAEGSLYDASQMTATDPDMDSACHNGFMPQTTAGKQKGKQAER